MIETILDAAVIAQVAQTPDLEVLASVGVGAVIVLALISVLTQTALSFLAQRNLNDQLSLGMQAIVGSNNLQIVDQQQDGDEGNGGGN
jgi:hypothetical protein